MADCLKDLEYYSSIHHCYVTGEIIGIEDKPIEKEPEIIIKKPEISNCFVTK